MILPITAYGDPILRKETELIDKDYPELASLIQNMFETMHNADGVGLAAPQIGKAIRLFVVDTTPVTEELDDEITVKMALINPEIIEYSEEEWVMTEGCLSIPSINEDVSRPKFIKIQYLDENFEEHTVEYGGYAARVIQHEYDHLEGELFVDHIGALKKRILKGKLSNISKGKVSTHYRLRLPNKK